MYRSGKHGHDSLLQFLIEAGANIEADGPANHVLPLWYAAQAHYERAGSTRASLTLT